MKERHNNNPKMISVSEIYEFLWRSQVQELDQILSKNLNEEVDSYHKKLYRLYQNRIQRYRGNFKSSLKLLDKIDYHLIEDNELKALYLIESGTTLMREGFVKEVNDKIAEIEKLRLSAQSEFGRLLVVEYHDLKAKIKITEHELQEADESVDAVLRLLEQVHHPRMLGSSYNNKGIISFYRGELKQANSWYLKSLEINTIINDTRTAGICHSNIGYNYYIMDKAEKSIEHLQKALEYFTDADVDYYIATAYFNMIRTYLLMDDVDNAKETFLKLEQIWEFPKNSGNDRIESVYKITKAQILMRGSRLRQKIRAQEIFKEIIQENKETQFMIIAMIHLAEILLLELRISENEEIIKEIEDIANKLETLAETTQSSTFKIHSVLVKAKISTIKGRYSEAFEAYKEAEKLADDLGIQLLHNQILTDLEEMKESVLKMRDVIDKNATLTQRIEHSEFDSYLKSLKNIV